MRQVAANDFDLRKRTFTAYSLLGGGQCANVASILPLLIYLSYSVPDIHTVGVYISINYITKFSIYDVQLILCGLLNIQ